MDSCLERALLDVPDDDDPTVVSLANALVSHHSFNDLLVDLCAYHQCIHLLPRQNFLLLTWSFESRQSFRSYSMIGPTLAEQLLICELSPMKTFPTIDSVPTTQNTLLESSNDSDKNALSQQRFALKLRL